MSTSRSLNKVMLIGNLTRNPVLKTTSSGATVCTFGVATNTTWKDADGNLQERAEFHNVVAWNKLAEICAQILAIGMLVYLEGELRTRIWDDESGTRRYRTEVKIDDMKLLDSKDKQGVGISAAKEAGNDESAGASENLEKTKEKEEKEISQDDDKKEEKKSKRNKDKKDEEKKEEKGNDEKDDDKEIEKEAEDLF